MNFSSNYKERPNLGIDYKAILRALMKNGIYILMLACIVGVWAYIILKTYKSDEYVSRINMVVVSRDNSSGSLNDYNMNSVVKRCASALNSEVLISRIKEDLNCDVLSGTLEAAVVEGSNMILLESRASDAEQSFCILTSAIKNYPKVSSYVTGGYLMEKMGVPATERITKNGSQAGYFAIILSMLVLVTGSAVITFGCIFNGRIQNPIQARQKIDADYLGELLYERKQAKKSILLTNPTVSFVYTRNLNRIVNVFQRKMKSRDAKSVMITSVLENEGKSTVSANMALALAMQGKKVLLIDTDLKRPALNKIFDKKINPDKEISSYLKGTNTYSDVISLNKEYGYYYCFGSVSVDDSCRALASDRFKQLLEQAAQEMDYIILDSPPCGLMRDAEILGEVIEETILVVRQNMVKAAVLNDTIDILEQSGTHVAGCILNAYRSKAGTGGNGYGYQKYYDNVQQLPTEM